MDDGLFYHRIAGVSHYQKALANCRPGQALRLVHEPDNPHDNMALMLETLDGNTVGYVPRRSGLHVAVLELGRGAFITIASIGYSRACLLGATITIALCDDELLVRSYYPDLPPPEPPRGGFRYWVSSPASVVRLLKERRGSVSPRLAQHPRYRRHSEISASTSQVSNRVPTA